MYSERVFCCFVAAAQYIVEFRQKMNGKADNLSDMTVLRFIRGMGCSELYLKEMELGT